VLSVNRIINKNMAMYFFHSSLFFLVLPVLIATNLAYRSFISQGKGTAFEAAGLKVGQTIVEVDGTRMEGQVV
jgi:C-terminal processing protease CtpA/Prc